MHTYTPDRDHTRTFVPFCKLESLHKLDNSNRVCQRGMAKLQCEVHREKTVTMHQSDVCACNSQQMPPHA